VLDARNLAAAEAAGDYRRGAAADGQQLWRHGHRDVLRLEL